jgi:hypothetical protein
VDQLVSWWSRGQTCYTKCCSVLSLNWYMLKNLFTAPAIFIRPKQIVTVKCSARGRFAETKLRLSCFKQILLNLIYFQQIAEAKLVSSNFAEMKSGLG